MLHYRKSGPLRQPYYSDWILPNGWTALYYPLPAPRYYAPIYYPPRRRYRRW